jgi:mannose-1-phosphate guanylyltransferase
VTTEENYAFRSAPTSPAFASAIRRRRWCVVLASGDGVRLRPLTRFICGDERPRQFCPLFAGGISLLQRTRQRVFSSIPAEQTPFAVTRIHQKFYMSELVGQESQLIVQPANRGTAPAILSGLLGIASNDSEALVAIMQCDRHFSDESLFTAAIESAFELAADQPTSVTLLAARPSHAEVEYGWIETVPSSPDSEETFRVSAFHEKPSADLASKLLSRGSLLEHLCDARTRPCVSFYN